MRKYGTYLWFCLPNLYKKIEVSICQIYIIFLSKPTLKYILICLGTYPIIYILNQKIIITLEQCCGTCGTNTTNTFISRYIVYLIIPK